MFSNINTFSVFLSVVVGILFSLYILAFYHGNNQGINFIKNYRYRFNKNLKNISLFFAVFSLIVAFWEPRGLGNEEGLSETKGDLVFVVDVTKSMNARDINLENMNISRLDLSKRIIKETLESDLNFEYGLVAFAGEGKKISPITSDKQMIEIMSSGLSYESILKEGTSFESGIEEAVNLIKDNNGLIVMLTDGGEEIINKGKIEELLKENTNLVVIGIGKEEDSLIPVGVNFFGEYEYKTYGGELIKTRLNKANIEDLAVTGDYYFLDESNFENIISDLTKDMSSNLIRENLEEKKNLSLYFVLISFIMFTLYIGLYSVDRIKK